MVSIPSPLAKCECVTQKHSSAKATVHQPHCFDVARAGHVEMVELLLKRKANPATTNKRGQSVLELSKPEVRLPAHRSDETSGCGLEQAVLRHSTVRPRVDALVTRIPHCLKKVGMLLPQIQVLLNW